MPTPLRLTPALILAALVLVVRYLVPTAQPEWFTIGLFGGLLGALLILLWWLLASRAPCRERALGLVVLGVAGLPAYPFIHPSIAGGMMGLMYALYAVPLIAVGFVFGLAGAGNAASLRRQAFAAVAAIIAAFGMTIVRTDGLMGESGSLIRWRWAPTAEERLLASAEPIPTPIASPAPTTPTVSTPTTETNTATPDVPVTPEATPIAPPEWPSFRGPNRDSRVTGVTINTDWASSPPVLMWQRPVGPGWSSFAVHGDVFYTQEQRGDDEVVSAYRVSTGDLVWRHADRVRFYESNGGPGPRGTPTTNGHTIYAVGATGILNALDARTGAVRWSRNVGADVGTDVPTWGFTSTPLLYRDLVIVAASGTLAGYDAATGAPRWKGPKHPTSYSSPHLIETAGRTQVLLMSAFGTTSVDPTTGATHWEHAWDGGTTIVQPAALPDGDIIVNAVAATGGLGLRRLSLSTPEPTEKWTSIGLKPYFNDFVVHREHAYGFDGAILSAIALADGSRVWKGGRYGNGQMVLLADQDLLIVLAEEGDLALVKAVPDGFTELARIPALDGKTWNHPVVVGRTLLVRNGERMAAYRLPAR